MLVSVQRNVKRLLDVRHAACHIQHHTVRVRADNREAVASGKFDHRLIIRFRRPEARREFRRLQKFVKVRTGRIVKLPQQFT